MQMKLGTRSNLKVTTVVGGLVLCGLAAPAFAHWGPLSAVVVQGQSAYCKHSHSGTTTADRQAKVSAQRYYDNGPEAPFAWWDNVTVTNRSSNGKRADIMLIAYDYYRMNFELVRVYQDVPYNHTRSLNDSAGPTFDVHASCEVSDNAQ
jgi:hypothetical protein